MNQAFLDYFRCPDRYADFRLSEGRVNGNSAGYFRFGADLIFYGNSGNVPCARKVTDRLYDVLSEVRLEEGACFLPFNPTDIANNFRYERYVADVQRTGWKGLVRGAYYLLRPCLPVSVRRHLQRKWLKGWNKISFPFWPVDRTVDQMFERLMMLSLKTNHRDQIPFVWFWPEGKSSCAIVTHDVETSLGLDFCPSLMDINDSFGIKSSFQIIPEARYTASDNVLATIR